MYFGRTVLGIEDVDFDGLCDYAVGAMGATGSAGVGAGKVSVHSGFDGTILYEVEGPTANYNLGDYSLTLIGDVDDDGLLDIAAGGTNGDSGAPDYKAASGGYVAFSSFDGSPLDEQTGRVVSGVEYVQGFGR